MQRYEKYKDSGVDWIGVIPEHWECKRLGTWFTERREKVSDKDYSPLSVTKNGIVPQLDNAAKSNDGDNRKLVKEGDFVINSRSDRKGSSGLSLLDGSVSLINIVMKPRNIDGKFSEYLLKSSAFVEEFYRNGHGIVADLWTTRFDEMKFINISVPPVEEQKKIVNFLNDKTAKIDQTIAIKEKEIELLKERRQILIQKAVTKGLDDTVKLKDSSVEWIGEIPEHWEVRKLKYVVYMQSGETITAESFTDEGYSVMGGNGFRGYTNKYTNEGNFILIGRQGALCGNVNYAQGKFFATEHAIVVYPNKDVLDILWLGEVIKLADLNKLSQTAAQPGISVTQIKNVTIPFIPQSEQLQIVEYLKKIEEKIAKAILLKQQEIEKLKEYKTVLIDNVVTGKVRVR